MKVGFPVREMVEKRISVRGYDGKKVSEEIKRQIMDYADRLCNPLGPKVRIKLIEKSTAANGEKLGTYGIIKGTDLYFGAAVPRHEHALEALGYDVEQLVLYLTGLGLGTCWLGGTFNRSAFAAAMEVGEDEIFPIISPVGYPAEKMRLIEKIMASGTKRERRMPWDELFFDGDFGAALTPENAGEYGRALDMVRLAPSAVNKQPWRVVKQGNTFHFFERHSLSGGEVDLQRVDVGIAICHFHLTVLEQGLSGRFERVEPCFPLPENTDYIVSWIGA